MSVVSIQRASAVEPEPSPHVATPAPTVDADGVLHGAAWGCWLAALLVLVTVTRNPWYLGLSLAWVAVVELSVRRLPQPGRGALWSPWRFGLLVIPLAAVFNMLTVHVGTTVLARLPAAWPLIGGPLTVEAALYGALNGLALTVIFAAFGVINRALALRQIVQLIPRAYYPVAVVVTIALTFVPATLAHWRQIREAQAVRGHRTTGPRSWLPLWLPLVTGGLERALQLAEAMTARGFAGGAQGLDRITRTATLLGLPSVLAGLLLRTVWGQSEWGLALIGVGAALVLAALWRVGQQRPHTRYRPALWRSVDWLVVAGALITAAACLLPVPGSATLYYSTYPSLSVPALAPVLGVASWGLLLPALVYLRVATQEAAP